MQVLDEGLKVGLERLTVVGFQCEIERVDVGIDFVTARVKKSGVGGHAGEKVRVQGIEEGFHVRRGELDLA